MTYSEKYSKAPIASKIVELRRKEKKLSNKINNFKLLELNIRRDGFNLLKKIASGKKVETSEIF